MSDLSTILGADLQLWYRDTHSGSGSTTTWVDSINAANVDASGISSPPTASTTPSGNLAWTFTGSKTLFTNTTPLSGAAANRVMFGCVAKVTSAPTADDGAMFQIGTNASAGIHLIRVRSDGLAEIMVRASDFSAAIFASNASVVDSQWHRYVVVWDGVTAHLYIDGVAQTNSDFTSVSTIDSGACWVEMGLRNTEGFTGSLASPFYARNTTGTSYDATAIANVDAYLKTLITTATTSGGTKGDNTTRPLTSGGDTIVDIARKTDSGSIVKTQVFKLLVGANQAVAGVWPLVTWDPMCLGVYAEICKVADEVQTLLAGPPPAPVASRGPIAAFTPVSAFDPTQLTDKIAWYRADLGATVGSGTITGWADQSGVGDANRNMVSIGTAPTYNASDATFGGQPSISLGFNNGLLSGTWNTTYSSPFTVYASAVATGINTAIAGPGFTSTGTSKYGFSVTNTDWTAFDGSNDAGDSLVPTSTASILCWTYAPGGSPTLTVYVGDSQNAKGTPTPATVVKTINAAYLGDLSGIMSGSAKVFELLVCNTGHDAVTRQKVMLYMAGLTGLSAS